MNHAWSISEGRCPTKRLWCLAPSPSRRQLFGAFASSDHAIVCCEQTVSSPKFPQDV